MSLLLLITHNMFSYLQKKRILNKGVWLNMGKYINDNPDESHWLSRDITFWPTLMAKVVPLNTTASGHPNAPVAGVDSLWLPGATTIPIEWYHMGVNALSEFIRRRIIAEKTWISLTQTWDSGGCPPPLLAPDMQFSEATRSWEMWKHQRHLLWIKWGTHWPTAWLSTSSWYLGFTNIEPSCRMVVTQFLCLKTNFLTSLPVLVSETWVLNLDPPTHPSSCMQ